MADEKLDQLTALPSPITTGDLLYVVRSSTDYKAASTDILPTAVLAASVLADTALVVGSGGVRGAATTTTGTGVVTALGVNVGSAGAVVVNGGALGTPSSGTATNLTGTAAGLTAGTASAVAVGGITGLGTGVATALAVNVGSAGAPVVLNGAGGTPSSMTGTNITGTAAGLTAGTASAIAVGGITGLGTGVGTALALNVGSAGAPVTFNGAGGTPSSMVGTNITGTASGLTAGNVTTNANLTGDVTSSGNATTLANIPSGTPMAGSELATNIVAPSTPASGKTSIYVDSTSKNIAAKNDAGTVNHGIQTRTATANNWIRSIADDGSSTISQPAFTDVSGTVAVNQGGTGLTAGTSGGVLAYTASGTLASSAALAANALVIGGGAGVVPSTITTGANVLTALGVAVGSAGAFVTYNGDAGTPSAEVGTNISGTAKQFQAAANLAYYYSFGIM